MTPIQNLSLATRERIKIYRKEYYLKNGKKNREKYKEKIKAYSIKERKKCLLYKRKWQIKHKYGITIEEYNAMLSNQNGKCLICGADENIIKQSLCIDHDHITNIVRGLLCDKCNLILGYANDNIDTLNNAIKYLERFHQLQIQV